MKRQIIGIILSALPLGIFAQEKGDSSNVLDDVMVKESFEAGFVEEKLPLHLSLDFSDVVQISERVRWSSVDAAGSERAGNSDNLQLQVAFPELVNIHPAPVKTFNVKFKDLERWNLDITASDGSLFRSLSGVGNPPEQIAWDGLSDNGGHLIPGEQYAYSFIAVDKAGNKKTFPGQSFAVPAFYLNYDNKFCVGIAQDALFASDGIRLKPEAGQLAREVAGLIRYFSTNGKVAVGGSSASNQEFVDQILRELVTDASLFSRINPTQTKADYLVFYME